MPSSLSGILTTFPSTSEFADTKHTLGKSTTFSTTTAFSSFRSLVFVLTGSTRISSGRCFRVGLHLVVHIVNNMVGVFS